MLALLSRGTSHFLNVRLESKADSSHLSEDGDAISIDINALSSFLLPSPDLPWRRVASVCGTTVSNAYKSIQDTLTEDVEHFARLLCELEPLEEGTDLKLSTELEIAPSNFTQPHQRRYKREITPLHRKCRRSLSPKNIDYPLLIPSSHPSAPSILITPCPNNSPCSSWVPLQDASFRNQLAVPGYPQFNSCFAPLTSNVSHGPILIERWKWRDGHWWAIIPEVDEQLRKGWFSRPLSARRRAVRPCRGGAPTCRDET